MNCPSCSAPMLFGSTSCACGYSAAVGEDSALEVSYWEALRAYWRVYWPAQLIGVILSIAASQALRAYINHQRELEPLDKPLPFSPLYILLPFQLLVLAALLFAFVSRMVSRPYSNFSLVVAGADGEAGHKLRLEQRVRVWFFVWWRQLVASLAAVLLAMPLNVLLSLMGLQISAQIATLAGLFIIGPVIVKMLVGNPFPSFSIEARR